MDEHKNATRESPYGTEQRPTTRLLRRVLLIAGSVGLILIALVTSAATAEQPTLAAWNCNLSSSTPQPTLGTTDYSLYRQPSGTVRAVMIFVDFPDARASESSKALYKSLVPHAREDYSRVSYGRLDLRVSAVHDWFRMPEPSTAYGLNDGMVSFEEHRRYIADAVKAADRAVDFRDYHFVYIVAARGAALPLSPAFTAYPGDGVMADGREIRLAATFGEDIRSEVPNYAAHVLLHETGHLFGLPDLYNYAASNTRSGYGHLDQVGGWGVMSWLPPEPEFLAWEKLKLGWLDPDQVLCLDGGQTRKVIKDLSSKGGLKTIVVRTGPSTAYVVEVRRLVDQRGRLCDKGVLIYRVDAGAASGVGPAVVRPARIGADTGMISRCGPLYRAAYDLGANEKRSYEDTAAGLKVKLIKRVTGGYTVRVVSQ